MVIQKYERHNNGELQSSFERFFEKIQLLGMIDFGDFGSDEKCDFRCSSTALPFCSFYKVLDFNFNCLSDFDALSFHLHSVTGFLPSTYLDLRVSYCLFSNQDTKIEL